MAFKLFELSPYCDGQESSTRYIEMSEAGLIPAVELGIDPSIAPQFDAFGRLAVATYNEEYRRLDLLAEMYPNLVGYPENATPKVRERIRKNYALDRARYFLPLTLRTNIAIVQTARAWTDTISGLLSLPHPEAQAVAERLIAALNPYAPNLIRHARRKKGWVHYSKQEIEFSAHHVRTEGNDVEAASECLVALGTAGPLRRDIQERENRYDRCGFVSRLTSIQVEWSGMAIAEARDINRHRTGERFFDATHRGLFLPTEVRLDASRETLIRFWEAHQAVLRLGVSTPLGGVQGALLPYSLVLGSQGTFYRTTTLAKFAYEAELRTGPGAHFRYAQHYRDALEKLYPLLRYDDQDSIPIGEAEPE